MTFLETAEDDIESRIFTSGGGLNLNSTTLTLLGRKLFLMKLIIWNSPVEIKLVTRSISFVVEVQGIF